MLVGMNMVIVILAMVIGYVALTAALNGVLGLFMHGLTIQKIFSYIFTMFMPTSILLEIVEKKSFFSAFEGT